jgi:tetratricopeptide (TPR) repeat protein
MTKPNDPRQRPRTEFRVAPPLVQRTNAVGFAGLDLLEDEDGNARLVFWQAYRDAELWSRAEERCGLFWSTSLAERSREVESLDPDTYAAVQPHLTVLLDLLRRPAAIDPEAVCDACAAIGSWFECRGLLRCAVEFALAATFAMPSRAGLAVGVARLLRMLTEYPRSISWFDYGLYLARRSNDWQAYTEALAGLGNLHFQLGNFPRARQYHRRCLRTASRKHLRDMVGAAYHNLFVLEMDAGNTELAESLANKAFAAYGHDSPSIVRLARDLSHRWTVLGHFARALPLALETLNHFSRPLDRAQVWADVGRAAGGTGERGIFEDAWAETWQLVRQGVADTVAAVVLMDLAHGACSLGDLRRAGHAATRALEIARQRKEGHTTLQAEAFLTSLNLGASESTAGSPPQLSQLPELERGIIHALRELRAAAA